MAAIWQSDPAETKNARAMRAFFVWHSGRQVELSSLMPQALFQVVEGVLDFV
jgi:hypothetical protein